MPNDENICGECRYFFPIMVPTGTGTKRETNHAHCLAKSVYAKNKPGKPVYPPGAAVEDLPHAQHKIVVVRKDQREPNCLSFKKKGAGK